MARSLNKVMLIGNAGKDPEVRYTPSSAVVANLTLATTDAYKDAGGQTVEKTEWHNLVFWGKTAEIVRDYVKKGNRLYVEGRIQTRSWDDKETNQKRFKTEIVVSDLMLLTPKPGGADGDMSTGNQVPKSEYAPEPTFDAAADDDLPF